MDRFFEDIHIRREYYEGSYWYGLSVSIKGSISILKFCLLYEDNNIYSKF
nr:hypothetical protein JJC16_03275 [Clostridioides sp. ES-S-0107-01]